MAEGGYIGLNVNIFTDLLSSYRTTHILNVSIPDKPLTNIELSIYARELEIPHFRGVFMHYHMHYHSKIVIVSSLCILQESCHLILWSRKSISLALSPSNLSVFLMTL